MTQGQELFENLWSINRICILKIHAYYGHNLIYRTSIKKTKLLCVYVPTNYYYVYRVIRNNDTNTMYIILT